MASVDVEIREGVAIATIDNPPVNPLSAPIRQALLAAVEKVQADASLKGLVIAAKGRAFIAGADITEFGKPPIFPHLRDVIVKIEASAKPVVAAIHGTCFGGGLELTLACHARLLGPGAKLALPEVKLGLLPGGGGTQRAPRLMGADKAVNFMTSGEPLSAEKAVAAGLGEGPVEGDLVAAAIAKVQALAAGTLPAPISAGPGKLAEPGAREAFEAAATALAKRVKTEPQVANIVALTRAAFDQPFAEALAEERKLFLQLVEDPRSKALRHAFFAEREAARIPGLPPGTKPREVKRVAVIGAGTMGGGIAMSFANAGIPVTLIETGQEALTNGLARVEKNYDTSVKRGSLTPEAKAKRMGLIEGKVGLEAAAGSDLVIEAVFEELELKKKIFAELDKIAPGALLASNTSYLDIDAMAAATSRPGDMLGMHFFSPANVMKLLEVVRAKETSPEAVATAMELGRRLGKVSVVAGVCYGFIGNRILARRTQATERLLLEGALPHEVDAALVAFGFRMGPCAMGDLAGLDISWRVRKATGQKALIADALCEAGRLGQKTGKGYYLYPEGAREGVPDPEVQALIERLSAEQGITRRKISQEEITERLVFPMINEGARILEEGIAFRPGDIDMVWLHGYNWPAWRGGPMHHADAVGLPYIAKRLAEFAKTTGDATLNPAPLLAQLAAEEKGFSSLKAA